MRQPRAFLFDEPLSNPDAKRRVQMRTEIEKIHRRLQTTVVYVTHDQIEAMTLADREQRYAPVSGRDLLLGIRPEHVTNRRTHSHADFEDFSADVKVVEPMGMDTMVFFDIGETEICSRCEPKSVSGVGSSMGFTVDKSQMPSDRPGIRKGVVENSGERRRRS